MTEKLKLNMSFEEWYEKHQRLSDEGAWFKAWALTGNLLEDIDNLLVYMVSVGNDKLLPKLKENYAYYSKIIYGYTGERKLQIGYGYIFEGMLHTRYIFVGRENPPRNSTVDYNYGNEILNVLYDLQEEMQKYYKQHEIDVI